MPIGSKIFTIDFRAAKRQFDWLEICLVYDKNDKHNNTYDSYNMEKVSTFIQSVTLENI